MRRSYAAALAVVASVGISSCVVFPHPHTLRPEAAFVVVSMDSPLHGATVRLYSIAYPYRRLLRQDAEKTDAQGRTRFSRLGAFEWGSLMMHGRTLMNWGWCVEHEGYATASAWDLSVSDFRPPILVHLQPGQSTECEAQGKPVKAS
jgi:hypothetical protein